MKLTKKQETFCIEYVKSGNASAAYRIAYNAENMSIDSVNKEAAILIKNPKISPRIELLKKRAEKIVMDKFDYDIEKLFKKVCQWIDSDITETINVSPKELKELPKEVRQLVTSFKHSKRTIEGVEYEDIELKFVSKEKAAEMLAKHLGFYSADNKQKGIDWEKVKIGFE